MASSARRDGVRLRDWRARLVGLKALAAGAGELCARAPVAVPETIAPLMEPLDSPPIATLEASEGAGTVDVAAAKLTSLNTCMGDDAAAVDETAGAAVATSTVAE